jgi:hypothetical protein
MTMWQLLKRLFSDDARTPPELLYSEMEKWCPACHHKPIRLFEGPQGGLCVIFGNTD